MPRHDDAVHVADAAPCRSIILNIYFFDKKIDFKKIYNKSLKFLTFFICQKIIFSDCKKCIFIDLFFLLVKKKILAYFRLHTWREDAVALLPAEDLDQLRHHGALRYHHGGADLERVGVGVHGLQQPGRGQPHFIHAPVELVVEVRVLRPDAVAHHALQDLVHLAPRATAAARHVQLQDFLQRK